jgi:hypothetical protein
MIPIQNPESLASLYSSPSLIGVALHEVSLHRDGLTLSLRFYLAQFPDRPPKKWHPAFNTAQVTLDLVGVSNLNISGFTTTPVGGLFLDQANSTITFNFSADGCNVSGDAQGAWVQRISGYENAEQ